MTRERLTPARVVDAALALVDREGVEALSMRRLGRTLGVEGMALYTHVAGKDALLDAVAARVLDELELPPAAGRSWRERIRGAVEAWARLEERHPRAFPLIYRLDRPVPAVLRVTEELGDALRGAGFDAAGAALAYQTLVCFLDGALLSWPEASYGAEAAWRRLAAQVPPAEFPRIAEIAPEAARLAWRDVWESGLELLLDGLEARLTRT